MLKIARGNSRTLTARITQGGEPYKYADGDRLIFTVKKALDKNAKVIIQKIVLPTDTDADGRILINLVPADTVDLKDGNYYYDLALESADKFFTVVLHDEFIVLPALSEIGGDDNDG